MTPGYGKILDIDLASRKIVKKEIDAEFARKYIGGVGFDCKILYDEVGHDVDPLGPENIIIFSIGALTGSGNPSGTRTEITTKHTLTLHIGTANTGGSWGPYLKHAGYETVIVRNKVEKPVYIFIDDDNVEIKNASHLWGKDAMVTTDMLSQELPPKIAAMAIGPGGENLVRYACPPNDHFHAAGRTGAGAVMGSENFKAIAVRSSKGAPEPARPEEFQNVVKEARARLIAADKAFWSTGPHDI
jgi:aldehyde:ferredoxin oxidoreductase